MLTVYTFVIRETDSEATALNTNVEAKQLHDGCLHIRIQAILLKFVLDSIESVPYHKYSLSAMRRKGSRNRLASRKAVFAFPEYK